MIRIFVIALLATTALSLTSVRLATLSSTNRGVFGTVPIFSEMFPAVGDFDGDGKLDLAVGNEAQGKVTVTWGPVLPGSSVVLGPLEITGFPTSSPIRVAFGDLNGDAVDDLVVSSNSLVYVILGQSLIRPTSMPLPTSAARVIQGPPSSVFQIAVMNLNGDSTKDLVLADATGVYVVLDALVDGDLLDLTDGEEHLNLCRLMAAGEKTIAVGNLNGDSLDDLLVAVPGNQTVTVLYGASPLACANLTEPLLDFVLAHDQSGFRFTSTTPTFGSGVDVAHFNSGTGADVIIGAVGESKAFVLYGPFSGYSDVPVSEATLTSGVVIETNTTQVGLGFGSSLHTVGDINKDGKEDVAIYSDGTGSGIVSVVYGFDLTTTPVQLVTLSGLSIEGNMPSEIPMLLPFSRGVGDINGDESPDVFIGGKYGRVAVVWGGPCLVDNYFNGSTCLPCHATCRACQWNSGDCLLCADTHWADGQKCTTCSTLCATGFCDATTHECTECTSSSYWPEGPECVTCDVGCATDACNGVNKSCGKCTAGYQMDVSSPQCVPCGNLTWSRNGTSCDPCIPTCEGCFAASGLCFLCNDTSKVTSDGKCQLCGIGQRSDPPGLACVGCKLGFGCLDCNQLGECTKCPAGKRIDGDRCRDCKDGEWSSGGAEKTCKACTTAAPCLGCDPLTGDCTGCPAHYGWSKTGCAQCSADQYSDGKSPCASCDKGDKCATCDPRSGLCTSCPDEYGIWGKGCTPCLKGTEFKNEVGYCQECELGGGCLTCEMTVGNCTKCPEGSEVKGTGCVALPSSMESVTSVIVESAASMISTLSALLFAAFVALLL